jgi:hypothetical protein
MRSRIANAVNGSKDPDPSQNVTNRELLLLFLFYFLHCLCLQNTTNNGFHAAAARWRSISAMLRAATSGPAAMSATNRSGIHHCSIFWGLRDSDP